MIANREELFERVRALHPEAVDLLARAIDYAVQAHDSQMRVSGEPYVTHPIEVASILADLRMDMPTIVAGVLHDVVEDTDRTLDDVAAQFGDTVATLVDGVTKLRQIKRKSKVDQGELDEQQAENLRKMFLAMV
ncbi:MAG: bifunctional (p)ppGpp synthetase/guanosine-3',5'-bis(diphosphate) 3'-pyrophosphohydrolase, partial [Chloroflexi bacterium]|nr:bifunctional (p)ppGpp synthetase/guanosine-3',5'-bis(diphosphate) 3'-pyrophosphohydrolase [Chloroflexota bacterium]